MATYSLEKAENNRELLEFILDYTGVEYTGSMDNSWAVKKFIDTYLPQAEALYNELKCEYETYIGY